MDILSFSKYKKTSSVVLCLIYILQLAAFGMAHYFYESSEDGDWVFLIGFWAMNITLIFLLDLFHAGIPKSLSNWNVSTILLFFVLSICYFYTLEHHLYWMSAVLAFFIAAIAFLLRYFWTRRFNHKYSENTKYVKDESVIRFLIYFSLILLCAICAHIDNVSPHSFICTYVKIVYITVVFSIISAIYFMWYSYVNKKTPQYRIILKIIWLLLCFGASLLKFSFLQNFNLMLVLPVLGVAPIIFHDDPKETK